MPKPIACTWSGVFPAATTQFTTELAVDHAETKRVQDALVREGVHGLVLLGTVGEGNSLNGDEKRAVLKGAVEVVGGRVPIITGVSEFTTATAATYARDAEKIGVAGLMVLPAMVYTPTPAELEYHFRKVAEATRLPITPKPGLPTVVFGSPNTGVLVMLNASPRSCSFTPSVK